MVSTISEGSLESSEKSLSAGGQLEQPWLVKSSTTALGFVPEAVCAMLDVLAARPERRKIAVLGEMRELGKWAGELHRKAGAYAASLGIDVVMGVCGSGRLLIEEALKKGMNEDSALFFETPEEAGDKLKELARTGDVILFKGSRGTRVELALERFLA